MAKQFNHSTNPLADKFLRESELHLKSANELELQIQKANTDFEKSASELEYQAKVKRLEGQRRVMDLTISYTYHLNEAKKKDLLAYEHEVAIQKIN
jgi:hypothetical protein